MKLGIIYKATSPAGKIYVGKTTKSLQRRKVCHKSNAFNTKVEHYNCHFYKAIRKYGFKEFIWEILYKDVPESKLSNLEIKTISFLDSLKNGYNSTKGGEGSVGFKHTEKSKHKMSKSSKGQIVSEETKRKLSKMRKGKKKSKEHIEKIKQSNIGKNAGAKHPFYGKKRAIDTISKIKATKRNSFINPMEVYNLENKLIGIWNNVAECVEDLDLQQPNVWKCLNGHRKTHKGYIFKYRK